ncbi:MAG: DesA family fatty acid desaturase [bacterium]
MHSGFINSLIYFLQHGLLDLSIWQLILVVAVMVQLTIFSVTLFLHRSQAHRAVEFAPLVNHLFRFWLWLTTSMVTRDWVAVHRKHHALCEQEGDPHSPQIFGIKRVFWEGTELYTDARLEEGTLEKYGRGTPDDWLERNVYSRFPFLGITLLFFLEVAAFGALGLTAWAIQVTWIPFWAAGVINGLGHWWGYRNFSTPDTSTNLTPIAFWIGGEELHNNHHAFPSSARFSMRGWEFDIGWQVIRLLRKTGLAKVLRLAPTLSLREDAPIPDKETLNAVFIHRFTVMRDYYQQVVLPVLHMETRRARINVKLSLRKARKLFSSDSRFLDDKSLQLRAKLIESSQSLQLVHEYKLRLQKIWDRHTTNPEQLLELLKAWVKDAENSQIDVLQDFAQTLRMYVIAKPVFA